MTYLDAEKANSYLSRERIGMGPTALRIDCEATFLIGSRAVKVPFSWTPMTDSQGYKWNGKNLEYYIPLYTMIQRMTKKDPYEYLFSRIVGFPNTGIPDETKLSISIRPVGARINLGSPRETRIDLSKLGYKNISKVNPSIKFPVWINLRTEKLALIDPAGLIHKVTRPRNFKVAYPFFYFYKYSSPGLISATYSTSSRTGRFTNWKNLPLTVHSGHGGILPPPHIYRPVRIKLAGERLMAVMLLILLCYDFNSQF